MEVGGQPHAQAALPPGITQYPLYRRLGEPQGQYARVQKTSRPPAFDPRTAHPVRLQLQDNYSGDGWYINTIINFNQCNRMV